MVRFFVRALLALAPALLMGAYARWPVWAAIPYYALIPWVVLYTDDRRPGVSLWYYSIAAYVGWILLYPQAFQYGWYAPVFMGLIAFLPMLAFAPLLRRIHFRFHLPRALSVPLVWVTVEWLRATFSVGHFDLYRIGYSQAKYAFLVQIADVVGAYGLSFLVAATNGLLADAFFTLRDRRWSPLRALRTRRLAISASVLAAAFLLAALYGAYRLGTARYSEGPRLAIVQPNIRHTVRNAIGVHLSQMLLTQEQVGAAQADLIVWPENAILDDIRRPDAYLEDLAWLAGTKDTAILVGALDWSPEHAGRSTNAAILMDRNGSILAQYDKLLLFPWSEYVPMDGLLGRIWPRLQWAHRALTRKGWGFLPSGMRGAGMSLFPLPWQDEELRFAVLICNENTYPPIPAEAGRMGARMFINITSEGEVGGPVQEQLLRICILRAVENRIPYVRVGNTGISGFIDPHGRVRSVLRGEQGRSISDRGVLIERVPLSAGGMTLYTRSRDGFAKLCLLATSILLLWSLFHRAPREAPAERLRAR